MSAPADEDLVSEATTAASIVRATRMVRTYGFFFRKRYNLPPTDPRFLDATEEQMMDDYWAHQIAEDYRISEIPVSSLRVTLAKSAVHEEPQA